MNMKRIRSSPRVSVNSVSRFRLLFALICSSGILMSYAPVAAGQTTEKVLHTFAGNSHGALSSVIRDSAGNLYGTTSTGGSGGGGTVYKVDAKGNQTILVNFTGTPFAGDGAEPLGGLIRDKAGNLYGTTASGGNDYGGTVFKIDATGTVTYLALFNPRLAFYGQAPQAGLVMDSAGNLYGTASSGGGYNLGTVFKIDTTGALSALYSFSGTAGDGANPAAGLALDSAGNLYGTTLNGGATGYGTVFKLDPTGHETVLHSFTGANSDGANPQSTLVMDKDANLYGTTINGGESGKGVVFKVDSTGSETVLHSFTGIDGDGANPQAGLILDKAGILFGTTVRGGATNNGTIFSIDPASTTLCVLHSFTGKNGDGSEPQASLFRDDAGNLYGTTWLGGAGNGGTIFRLDSADKETVLFSFAGTNGDGAIPQEGLVRDDAGNLYGTTLQGGMTVGNCTACGTVFKVDSTGKKTVLYYFTGTGGDGAGPQAGLVRDAVGNLYGTTYNGGTTASSGYGTVFKLDSMGNETVLYNFKGGPNDGANPQAGLIRDSAGNLYGTTVSGGTTESGTVFKLDPTGHETILHSFGTTSGDGLYPKAGLVQDPAGNLYGTTSGGTVFKLDPTGTLTVLHSFTGGTDGGTPLAALILDSAGNLYGTAAGGGDRSVCQYDTQGPGCGTVFKIDPTGVFTVLYTFTGTNGDGVHPQAALIRDSAGNLYGTTVGGGANAYGTFFRLDTTGHETVLYNFTGWQTNGDGYWPTGVVMDNVGNFYGITAYGGTLLNTGTVFVVQP